MFQCLSISFKGKGELKNLSQWEIADKPRRILGDDLILAMYVNELILRLLPENDEYSEIFHAYWNFLSNLKSLNSNEKEYALRDFENQMLEDLGYGIDFSSDMNDEPINENLNYEFIEHQGFSTSDNGLIPGKILVNLLRRENIVTDTNELSILKKMNRKRLKSLLGDKPLKSKELFFLNR